MTAEQAIASLLARRVGSLIPGHRHRIFLDQVVLDGVGRWQRGPHPIGWVEPSSSGLTIRLIPTAATRTAVGLLEEDLLDVVLTGYPAVVKLTSSPLGDSP